MRRVRRQTALPQVPMMAQGRGSVSMVSVSLLSSLSIDVRVQVKSKHLGTKVSLGDWKI